MKSFVTTLAVMLMFCVFLDSADAARRGDHPFRLKQPRLAAANARTLKPPVSKRALGKMPKRLGKPASEGRLAAPARDRPNLAAIPRHGPPSKDSDLRRASSYWRRLSGPCNLVFPDDPAADLCEDLGHIPGKDMIPDEDAPGDKDNDGDGSVEDPAEYVSDHDSDY